MFVRALIFAFFFLVGSVHETRSQGAVPIVSGFVERTASRILGSWISHTAVSAKKPSVPSPTTPRKKTASNNQPTDPLFLDIPRVNEWPTAHHATQPLCGYADQVAKDGTLLYRIDNCGDVPEQTITRGDIDNLVQNLYETKFFGANIREWNEYLLKLPQEAVKIAVMVASYMTLSGATQDIVGPVGKQAIQEFERAFQVGMDATSFVSIDLDDQNSIKISGLAKDIWESYEKAKNLDRDSETIPLWVVVPMVLCLSHQIGRVSLEVGDAVADRLARANSFLNTLISFVVATIVSVIARHQALDGINEHSVDTDKVNGASNMPSKRSPGTISSSNKQPEFFGEGENRTVRVGDEFNIELPGEGWTIQYPECPTSQTQGCFEFVDKNKKTLFYQIGQSAGSSVGAQGKRFATFIFRAAHASGTATVAFTNSGQPGRKYVAKIKVAPTLSDSFEEEEKLSVQVGSTAKVSALLDKTSDVGDTLAFFLRDVWSHVGKWRNAA